MGYRLGKFSSLNSMGTLNFERGKKRGVSFSFFGSKYHHDFCSTALSCPSCQLNDNSETLFKPTISFPLPHFRINSEWFLEAFKYSFSALFLSGVSGFATSNISFVIKFSLTSFSAMIYPVL